ncbi:type II toxin-antitoxin system VapC family toxin [Massilia sp. SM-13]|uniref:type II toxin-antitoxin system VapC family toxin n=1 Tax=Pseudoduganella rhizocola TaxID=3382643 RepID=UPI0038B44FA9
MTLLLDTQLLLWIAAEPARIPPAARALLEVPVNEFAFSAASVWEVAIKRGLRRRSFLVEPDRFRDGLLNNGLAEVPITSAHAVAVRSLPLLHKDPFDRILLAQAIVEGFSLVTTDLQMRQYNAPIYAV